MITFAYITPHTNFVCGVNKKMNTCKVTECMITTKYLFDDLYVLICQNHDNIVGVFCLENDRLGSDSSIMIEGRIFYYYSEYYNFLKLSN